MSYHQDYSRVSKTMLGHFMKSHYDYYRYYVAREALPPQPNRAMVIGSAVHKILLERAKPEECLLVYPDECLNKNGGLIGVNAAKFRDANPDKFVVKQEDAATIGEAVVAALNHDLGDLIAHPDAVFELPQQWIDSQTQLPCRMMADFYCDMGDEVLAYDLKTTERIYPSDVRRTFRNLRYWLQDAHYSNGLETILGKPVRFAFWLLEVKEPYRICRWEYKPSDRDNFKPVYQNTMETLARCYREDHWEDDWTEQTNYAEYLPWEAGADEEGEVAYVSED